MLVISAKNLFIQVMGWLLSETAIKYLDFVGPNVTDTLKINIIQEKYYGKKHIVNSDESN